MARKKDGNFGAADGFDFNDPYVEETRGTIGRNTKYNNNTQVAQHVQEPIKEIGTTQGKKGYKLKRINMAFSDVNHAYITFESRRRGLSATAFVNEIIDKFRAENE